MAFFRLRSMPSTSPLSCISMHRWDHLFPGAAQQSRMESPGWGSRMWEVMRDGKFCMRRSLGRDSRGGKSTILTI